MKRKWKGSSLITFLLVIMAVFLYVQFFMVPDRSSEWDPNAPMPDGLHPIVEEKANQLLQQAGEKGIHVVITDGFRSAEEQDQLYEKGRSTAGSIVTYAKGGESYHNFGLAVDFALKIPSGEVIWDMTYDGNGNSIPDWTEVVTLAKDLGFEWGGDWVRFKDYPHLQMDFGLSIAALQSGARPEEHQYQAAE